MAAGATETRSMHPNYTPAALKLTGDRNPRGIPMVNFIEDVEGHLLDLYARGDKSNINEAMVSECVGVMQELYSKYKFMETHMQKNKANYKDKLPELTKSIAIVEHLKQKQEDEDGDEPTTADFNLSDNIYTKATLDVSGKVCLWLGANVMLEYSYDEALEMLNRNLAGANQKLENCTEDLQFLRDQIITSEVNMARVFNYDVRRRRDLRDAALGVEGAGGEEEAKGGEAASK